MYTNSLSHHGILGQKWGIRRYQNADGSLTPEGKTRYEKREMKDAEKNVRSAYKKAKYASAVTSSYQNRINRPSARDKPDELKERRDKSQRYEAQLTKQANKEYKAFIKKYGKENVSDLAFNDNKIIVQGEKQINAILFQTSLKSAAINAVIPFGPVGWVVGGAYGYVKDSGRRADYERALDKMK